MRKDTLSTTLTEIIDHCGRSRLGNKRRDWLAEDDLRFMLWALHQRETVTVTMAGNNFVCTLNLDSNAMEFLPRRTLSARDVERLSHLNNRQGEQRCA